MKVTLADIMKYQLAESCALGVLSLFCCAIFILKRTSFSNSSLDAAEDKVGGSFIACRRINMIKDEIF